MINTPKKSQNTCLSLLLRELFLRNSSNNASSLAINPSLTFFCFNLGALNSGIVMLKTGLDRASTVGKLGYWTSRASEIRRQRRVLGGTLSTSPAQFTTIVASMFVNKTKTTLRAHTVDKNTSSVCGSKRRFRPKPHAPVLFLSIYRVTVPLTNIRNMTCKCLISIRLINDQVCIHVFLAIITPSGLLLGNKMGSESKLTNYLINYSITLLFFYFKHPQYFLSHCC